jgi:hypothetical protein
MPDYLPPGLEPIRDALQANPPTKWQEVPIYDDASSAAKKAALRLNALGSLFFFSKYVLGHTRLSSNLHGYMCSQLEQDTVRLVMEIPRDHFKTTIASVSAPMWWALPFTAEDEDLMYQLGYGEEWMRWMRRAHNPYTRTLVASETIQNARKIGVKIDGHYNSNAHFRFLFPSIIPKDTARWSQDSMTHNRPPGEYHGEGTFDFIGVKGALQSRHYDRQVIDDPVGEKAINSELVMEGTIDWIRKLPGAFDSDPRRPHALADQLFIGNRWSQRDVGSWLRKNVPNLHFVTHSAEGGCPPPCTIHPPHTIIFPEEITWEKLAEFRAIYGSYNYACQMLNNPIDADAVKFKEAWLRHYAVDVWNEPKGTDVIVNWQQLSSSMRGKLSGNPDDIAESQGMTPKRLKVAIKHETEKGEIIEDIKAGDLDRFAFMDPNHAEEKGRACNAILVVGVYNRPPAKRRIYLLDCWSKASAHEEWLEAALGTTPGKRGLVLKWRCHVLFIESEVAGQSGWKFAIRERMRKMGMDASFSLRPLKTERSANAKKNRIEAMEPIFENGLFWVPRFGCQEWKTEYSQYPNGSTIDLMDLTGYIPQCLSAGSRLQTRDFVKEEMQRSKANLMNVGPAGY